MDAHERPSEATEVLEVLRGQRRPAQLLRGFGPLVVAVVFLVVMVVLAPSIAGERVVERPVDTGARASTVEGGR